MIDIGEVTRQAVMAALLSMDNNTNQRTARATGACGDKLAVELHKVISNALKEEYSRSN